jgi:TonB family protein
MSTSELQSLSSSYTWAFPGSPIQVRVRLSVINELQKRLDRQLRSEQGTESICGLLLGDATRPNGPEISGFDTLAALTPSAVEGKHRRAVGDVVGFYRTTERGSLRMTEQDRSLARTHFANPHSVVLLIETDKNGPGNAGFFFWDQGQIHGDLALMEFPFDAHQLSVNEQMRARARDEAVPVAENRGRASLRGWTWGVRPLLVAVALVLGATASYSYFTRGRQIPAVTEVQADSPSVGAGLSLGLLVERRGSDLLLTWNRLSAPVVSASSGEVLIREGNASRTIRLNQKQLRAGSVLYAPTTDQVELQLNVVAGEKVAGESITAVLPRVGAAHPVPTLITSAQSFESESVREPHATFQPQKPLRKSAASASREFREFSIPREPASHSAAPAVALTEPPPAVVTNSVASSLAAPLNLQVTVPPPVSTPASAVPTSLAPTVAAQGNPVPPSAGPPVNRQTEPRVAIPIHKVMPRFPSEMKPVLVTDTAVDVLVYIDARGKVTRAEPARRNTNIWLTQAALDAARGWTFQPAIVGTTAVASEMVLTFKFTPR